MMEKLLYKDSAVILLTAMAHSKARILPDHLILLICLDLRLRDTVNYQKTLYSRPERQDPGRESNNLTQTAEKSEKRCHAESLVAIGKSGDRQAFIEIFNFYAPRIKSFLMRSGISPDQAEELAQETMLAVWDKAGSYDPSKAAASTWLYTIARNKKIDFLRKNARPDPDPHDPYFQTSAMDSQDEDYIFEQDSEVIAKELQKLPEAQADLIRKAFFEDKTHHEIAKQTNIPLGTVKSRIRLALGKLEDTLSKRINPHDKS